jgi:uncharacterized protein (TIGR03083 family)
MSTSAMVSALSIPRIGHAEAMRITATENGRLLDQLHQVGPEDWDTVTDCPRWTVRDMVVHLIASAQAQANPVEFARQVRQGRKLTSEIGGQHWVDGLNEAQLRARTTWTAQQLPPRWQKASSAALGARSRMPPPIRALPLLPMGSPLGTELGWKPLGYLFDMGFTRDVWMHRIDIARAVGRPLILAAEHDGRIVADLVAEWVRLHTDPFTLELLGPAGGRYTARGGDEPISLDAVEFARILSGRGDRDGVLRHKLPL